MKSSYSCCHAAAASVLPSQWAAWMKARRPSRFQYGLVYSCMDAAECRRRESPAGSGRRRAACRSPACAGAASGCSPATPFELRPDRLEPGLVLRELRVPDAGPEHDAVFLGEIRPCTSMRAVGLLEGQFVGHAVARFLARAEHRRRFQQERAVHDPQPAVARRADLKRRQALLDLARLPDVADGGIHQRLNARVRHLHAAEGQRRFLPVRHRAVATRQRLRRRCVGSITIAPPPL